MVNEGNLRLIVEPASLARTTLGTRTGVVYFQYGSEAFPSNVWNDLAPDFSYAWLNAVIKVVSGTSHGETVFFMDGAYVVELTANDPGLVKTHFYEDRPNRKIDRGSVNIGGPAAPRERT